MPTSRRLVAVSLSDPTADFSAQDVESHADGTRFTLLEAGEPAGRLASPLVGTHNLRNTLGAIALTRGLGLSVEEIAKALPRFAGVRRRLEVKGEKNGIVVVDDFAHHPTAVAGTIAAARTRWPGRRIWALFEPRSNTAGRKMFEDDYGEAFSAADALVIGPIFHAKRLKAEERIDRAAVLVPLHVERKAGLRAGEPRRDPGDPAPRDSTRRRAAADVVRRVRRASRDAARRALTRRAGLLLLLALPGLFLYLWPAFVAPVVLWSDSALDLDWARRGVGIVSPVPPAPAGAEQPAHPAKPAYLLFLRAVLAVAPAAEGPKSERSSSSSRSSCCCRSRGRLSSSRAAADARVGVGSVPAARPSAAPARLRERRHAGSARGSAASSDRRAAPRPSAAARRTARPRARDGTPLLGPAERRRGRTAARARDLRREARVACRAAAAWRVRRALRTGVARDATGRR